MKNRAMARLEYESTTGGDELLFVTLRPFLTGDDGTSYAAAAETLKRGEGAVRVAVHRLRRRFGRCLRETLADTVDDPADVDAELFYLLDVLARRHRTSSLNQPSAPLRPQARIRPLVALRRRRAA